MNSKWIVPVVAVIMCAVSLIGAGYAAYTATLTDSETAEVDQNYIVLNTGTGYAAAGEIDVYWDTLHSVVDGAAADPEYMPYLDVETTDNAVKYGRIFALSVAKDVTEIGDEVTDSNSYTLTITSHSCTNVNLTGTSIAVFTDAAMTNAANLSALSYNTPYYVALGYQHNDADNLTGGNSPSASATVTVLLSAQANLVTKS